MCRDCLEKKLTWNNGLAKWSHFTCFKVYRVIWELRDKFLMCQFSNYTSKPRDIRPFHIIASIWIKVIEEICTSYNCREIFPFSRSKMNEPRSMNYVINQSVNKLKKGSRWPSTSCLTFLHYTQLIYLLDVYAAFPLGIQGCAYTACPLPILSRTFLM